MRLRSRKRREYRSPWKDEDPIGSWQRQAIRSRSVDGEKPCGGPRIWEGLSGPHWMRRNRARERGHREVVSGCRRGRFFEGCPRRGKGSTLVPPGLGLPDGGGRWNQQRGEPQPVWVAKHPKPSRGANRRGAEKPRGRTKWLAWQWVTEGRFREGTKVLRHIGPGIDLEWTRDGDVGGGAPRE
jgi:hypothetical protein